MPWHLLRVQHTQALRAELADRYAAATANKMLAALRGVLRSAWELGQIDTDSYQRAIAVRAVRGETVPRGRSISEGEFRALFRACLGDHTPMGRCATPPCWPSCMAPGCEGPSSRRSMWAITTPSKGRSASGRVRAIKIEFCYTAVGERQLLEAWFRARAEAGAPRPWVLYSCPY